MALVIPEAALRLCRQTPLVYSAPLGCQLKLESLQVTGSFKLRGAAVKLARLGAPSVVTASAGNHGLGVALAAQAFGMTATVVVPRTSARVKQRGIAQLGAEVLIEGEGYDDAEQFARALATRRGAPFVSAFDDDDVIDGNGRWLGRELIEQRPSLKRVVLPVGGGGMIGGLGAEVAPRGVEVIGVQPVANCAMHESLAVGHAQTRYVGGHTLCEGLEGAVAVRTFELVRAHVKEILLVDEEEVLAAMAFGYRMLGQLVEPSAAVCLAAVRTGRVAVDEETAIVVSGGNVDREMVERALTA